MARRSHTEAFILLRNNASKTRHFYKDFDNDDERVKLVNGKNEDVNDIELDDNCSTSLAIDPNWISSVDQFRYECNKIHTKIEQLNDVQSEHLKKKVSSIFVDDNEVACNQRYELEIEFKCQELNKLFNRLHALLTQMQSLSQSQPRNKLFQNIFQWQVREVSDLTQMFRSCQRNYLNKCSEGDKLDEFVIKFDELISSNSDCTTFLDNNTYHTIDMENLGSQSQSQQQQQQQMTSFFDSETLKSRDQEMSSIVKSIVELNQIFHDINTFVINQGSLLDRIDYNIDTVERSVEEGVISLSKAERNMKRARKIKFILIMSAILFALLIFFVIFGN